MFPEKFKFDKNEVRTKDINPIFLKIASVNKGLCKNKKRDKSNNLDLSHEVHYIDLFSNQILGLFEKLDELLKIESPVSNLES